MSESERVGARCHHCGHYETSLRRAEEKYAHCPSCDRHTRWLPVVASESRTEVTCADSARAEVLRCAALLETQARGMALLRSVDATESAKWLREVAAELRKAAEPARDTWWHCKFCGDHEPAEEPYELGDKEPCIKCGMGTAHVMTLKQAAKFESEVAQGIREREASYV